MTRWIALVTLLAACSEPAAEPDAGMLPDARLLPDGAVADAVVPDAADPTLACLGQPPPATAPDPLAVGGTVFSVVDLEIAQLPGATVEVRRRADDALLVEAVTDGEGRFDVEVSSGGLPVDAYFQVVADGYLPTRGLPGYPLAGGENALLVAADAAEVAAWYAQVGDTYEPDARTVIAGVADCEGHGVAGASVTVAPPPATLTYYDDPARAWNPALEASTNGFALLTRPAASVAVTAAAGDLVFPGQQVAAPPGMLTMAVITPHD